MRLKETFNPKEVKEGIEILESLIGEFDSKFTEKQRILINKLLKRMKELSVIPCKIGDEVWYVDNNLAPYSIIKHFTVTSIVETTDGFKIYLDNESFVYPFRFGKSRFLKEEQAKARLKELRRKKYNN